MSKYSYFLWCISLLFTTCDPNIVYTHTHQLDNTGWQRNNLLSFNFNIQDTTQAYDIYLLIKNTPDYPYQNLFLTYYLKDNQSTVLATKLKNCLLFEPKIGKPLGKGWTKNKSHEVIMIKNHYFVRPGTYTLELAQFMRIEMLTGIAAIGIKICKSGQAAAE